MRSTSIAGRTIGDGQPAYLIAELGINHNGDVALAKEMAQAAWEAGADAVKIQSFVTREFLHPSHPGFDLDVRAEIPHDREREIWEFARARGITIFSTPEEHRSLEFIRTQRPPAIKIAAMDFNYRELVQAAASLGVPILLSSGMSTLEEVVTTVAWVTEAGNSDYIILHCTSCYPTQPVACNLTAIRTLREHFGCPVGYSDHTVGTHLSIAAVALGAAVVEKHFTLDKRLPGPDQACSMDPADVRSLAGAFRELEAARGTGVKAPATEELAPRRFKRRGIYANRDVDAGSVLTREMVTFFAPSSETSRVTDWPIVEGKRLKRRVCAMERIALEDVA